MQSTLNHQNDAECWIIDDQRPGHINQSRALADALGLESDPLMIPMEQAAAAARKVDVRRRLLLGCGRRAAQQVQNICHQQPGSWISIQILDPRRNRQAFDWLLVPEHDRLNESHILPFSGALNAIDDQWLDQMRDRWPEFAQLPEPRLAMLLGGPVRHCRWTRRQLSGWLERAGQICQETRGSLLLVTSRRTPDWAIDQLQTNAPVAARVIDWRAQTNGYPGVLAWANRTWVSADSISMLAEACATNLTVTALAASECRGRHRQYVASLSRRGRLASTEPLLTVSPIRETSRLAATLIKRGALLGLGKQPRID